MEINGQVILFSGTTINAKNWNSEEEDQELCKMILFLRDKIASRFGFEPNFVLINRYNNEDQYIGYHVDDEKDLSKYSPIAGISFGSEREIIWMSKTDSTNKKKMLLKNGSAYCMHFHSLCNTQYYSFLYQKRITCGPTNQYYIHSIPKQKGIKSPRISFTFRQMAI